MSYKAVFTPQLWDRNGSGTQPGGHPCSHLFHCVRSFRNEPTTSRCDRSGTVPERVRLALWCERATGPVPEPFQLPVTLVDSQPLLHISKRSLLHGILPQIVWSATSPDTPIDRGTSHDQICEKCPTAPTSDDLDNPRAPVQIMLFVAQSYLFSDLQGHQRHCFVIITSDELITRW